MKTLQSYRCTADTREDYTCFPRYLLLNQPIPVSLLDDFLRFFYRTLSFKNQNRTFQAVSPISCLARQTMSQCMKKISK